MVEREKISSERSPPPDLRRLWESGEREAAIRGALQAWDALPHDGGDLHWLVDALRTCGLGAESCAVQLRLLKRRPSDSEWVRFIRSVASSGDPWWARRLLAEVGDATRELQALRIDVELAVGDAAPLIASWRRTYRDDDATDAAVRWLVRSDRLEEAVRLVDASRGLALWRARFALWRNQPDVARGLLETVPPTPESRCLEAIAAVLEGDLPQGETRLRELDETEVRGEAWTWLATVLRKQGRFSEAIQAAEAAANASAGFNLVARLELELADDYRRLRIGASSPRSLYGRTMRNVVGVLPGLLRLHRIEELETAAALYPLGLQPSDTVAAVEAVLERFAGNHSVHLTTTEHGTLHAYPIPENPRQLGANVQNVLWTRGADACRALYEELAPRVDDHPLFRIYHGELELWMGAYEQAERIFRTILDRNDRVRWAWIGLGASVMLQGDLAQAQRIWTRGVSRMKQRPGPTLYAYRGECYRRQGELRRARKELETGLRLKPKRLSSRINLALLDHDPTAMDQAMKDCTDFAPILMAQLKGSTAERLEQVLEAMRGNRSSSEWGACYHLWGHVWRRGVG